MTAATEVRPVDAGRHVPVEPVTQGRVIRSEWIKFRSLRSSWLVMGGTVLVVVAIAALVGYFTNNHFASMSPGERANFNPVDRSLTGTYLAQLTVGVLGVLVISGEYSTGMIRATLAAAPTRVPVVVAKGLVYAAVTFAATLVAVAAAFFVGQALLGSHGVGIGHAGALRAVVGAALYLTGVGLAGVALGFLVRSTAGGIASLFGLLLILPVLVQALPSSWVDTIDPYLPSNAGQALYQLHSDHHTLAPWAGFGVFLAYVAVLLVAAVVVLRRRDA